jgi:hypothetical protein
MMGRESMTTRLEEIAKREPVDRTAAGVTSRSLESPFHPKLAPDELFSPTPLPVRINPTFSDPSHDLTGQQIGRFTVVGLFADGESSSYGRWVVRCACGWYCTKKTRVLKRPRYELMCVRCHKIDEMRQGISSLPCATEMSNERRIRFLRRCARQVRGQNQRDHPSPAIT